MKEKEKAQRKGERQRDREGEEGRKEIGELEGEKTDLAHREVALYAVKLRIIQIHCTVYLLQNIFSLS